MLLYRAQCSLVMDSGVPADAVTNTLYFTADSVSDLSDVSDQIELMYREVEIRLSSLIALTGHEIKYYSMLDPEPRAPVATDPFSLSATSSTAGIRETAICMSFQGDKVSGEPQARKRGRIYLGPLAESNSDNQGRPNQFILQDVQDAGAGLLAASDAAAAWTWVVYSPTSGLTHNVTNGWVDNEFDTQRRRGRPATARSTF